MSTIPRQAEQPPYVVREVPPHLRTARPVHELHKDPVTGVHRVVKKETKPEGPQYDVFMRSGSSVRMTKEEFEEFEEQYNPQVDPEAQLMKVFVGSEQVEKE